MRGRNKILGFGKARQVIRLHHILGVTLNKLLICLVLGALIRMWTPNLKKDVGLDEVSDIATPEVGVATFIFLSQGTNYQGHASQSSPKCLFLLLQSFFTP